MFLGYHVDFFSLYCPTYNAVLEDERCFSFADNEIICCLGKSPAILIFDILIFLCNCLLADDGELSQEGSKDSFIDKDDICAKIESLGGMVIEKYDEEIVSIFGQVFS